MPVRVELAGGVAVGMMFYLGTHHPHWLDRTEVPLFVSRRSLIRYKTLPRARGEWALDSGGFSELSLNGSWETTPRQYVADVRRFGADIGKMNWVAPQDWMCEPVMLKKTGLSVSRHQELTVANLLELRSLAPELPIVPVLQGWSPWDYLRHIEMYAAAGVDLTQEKTVGVGSVCRRQNTAAAQLIFQLIRSDGVEGLHGFGLKKSGLAAFSGLLQSADSLAWSYRARREPPMPGHTHKNCANCMPYAMNWRDEILVSIERGAHACIA